MPSPDYFLHAQDQLLGMLDEFASLLVADIARRIVKTGTLTETAVHQNEIVKQSRLLHEDVIKRIGQLTGYTETEIRRLFKEAAEGSIEDENKIYQSAGMETHSLADSSVLKSVLQSNLRKTLLDVSNLTLTTAVTAQTAYINACNMAQIAVQSGGLNYDKAIANAIKQAAVQGVTVSYPSGHVDQLDVAIRRAVLTGTNQSCADINLQYAKEIGSDYVETTAHSGARPSHALWQGQVFCISGKDPEYPPFYETTGYGTGDGLCGWNCRHSFYAFIPGISKPAYTKEMLEDYNAPKYEYNGKKYTEYEISQMQRQKERNIRATKRKLAGYDAGIKNTDDPALKKTMQQEFEKNSVHLKKQEAALKDFCKQTGRRYESARTQVHAVVDNNGNIVGFNRSVAQKAVWSNKMALANKSKFTERLEDFNNGQKDIISHWSLQRNLNKSQIGKEAVKYIAEHPEITITMLYKVDNPKKLNGFIEENEIFIYASKTKTVQKSAETIIHEVTHHKINKPASQWQECRCFINELKHRYNTKNLTIDQAKNIIKLVKELYPELPWRR